MNRIWILVGRCFDAVLLFVWMCGKLLKCSCSVYQCCGVGNTACFAALDLEDRFAFVIKAF